MSTLDREPRTSGTKNDAFCEPRVAAGSGRVNQPQKLSPKPPRGPDLSGITVRKPSTKR